MFVFIAGLNDFFIQNSMENFVLWKKQLKARTPATDSLELQLRSNLSSAFIAKRIPKKFWRQVLKIRINFALSNYGIRLTGFLMLWHC